MAKIPEFKTLEEEQEFWQTHSAVDYLDDTEEVSDEEVAAINAREQDRQVARLLSTIRSELGDGAAEAIRTSICDLIEKECRQRGVNLSDILARKKAA